VRRDWVARVVLPPPGVPDWRQLQRGPLHMARVSAEKAVESHHTHTPFTHRARYSFVGGLRDINIRHWTGAGGRTGDLQDRRQRRCGLGRIPKPRSDRRRSCSSGPILSRKGTKARHCAYHRARCGFPLRREDYTGRVAARHLRTRICRDEASGLTSPREEKPKGLASSGV
jgi:hypothetical protein